MIKKTRQKEAILKVLRATTSHPTAEWVYGEVRKEIPSVSLGTVYRNLRLLSERGEISELAFNGGPSRFEGRKDAHYHFVCEKCGEVFDVDEPVHKELSESIANKTGFEVSHYRLEFAGLCKKCLKRRGARKARV